jgi:hypothetical protein
MTLQIEYDSEGFPAGGPVTNGAASLSASWSDVLRAAVTVGRPNWRYVFRHGMSSAYEALFRWSLIRMTLEQSGPRATRFCRTQAARTLDPSEKGAVNYFLGLAVAKLFADKLLDAPWMLHLDVFRPNLNVVLSSRSRPDLVGATSSGQWLAFECKGRVSEPDASVKTKAKYQAQRVVTVNGIAPAFAVGALTYFKNDTLRFFWRDPEPDLGIRNPIRLDITPSAWRLHYEPVLELIRSKPQALRAMRQSGDLVPVDEADLKVGIHPRVLELLENPGRADPRPEQGAPLRSDLYGADGIAIITGESWNKPLEEFFG